MYRYITFYGCIVFLVVINTFMYIINKYIYLFVPLNYIIFICNNSTYDFVEYNIVMPFHIFFKYIKNTMYDDDTMYQIYDVWFLHLFV